MSISYQLSLYYVIVINIITLILYGIDKLKAKKGWWRIPEATLLIFAIIGGSVGALCAMKLFHHKTMHKKFYLGVPAILIAQLVITFILI